MRTWKVACVAAALVLGVSAAPAHADEFNKLTYLTFSAPVALPGIALPAGTYRFELMDPNMSRRVIRVSEEDGSKTYGIFLSISDRKLDPSNDPVVMFREMPAGLPQAVRAWFYPGETYGYEFVYPHDQAQKIAKATRQPVLAMNEPPPSKTDDERVASMRGAEVGRIDENGRPVSTDEQLKDSSRTAASTSTSNTASSPTTAAAISPSTANTTTANSSTARSTTSKATTARSTGAASSTDRGAAGLTAAGTSGRSASLPRTASPIPAVALLSLLSLLTGIGVHVVRRALA